MRTKKITPEWIDNLYPHDVFVFGSNEAGKHRSGAAKTAMEWGAEYGKPEGLQGQTYALPTLDENLQQLPLSKIKEYVEKFNTAAENNPDKTFYVTEVGCGIAGFTPEQIAPFFAETTMYPHVFLPQRFWDILEPYEFSAYAIFKDGEVRGFLAGILGEIADYPSLYPYTPNITEPMLEALKIRVENAVIGGEVNLAQKLTEEKFDPEFADQIEDEVIRVLNTTADLFPFTLHIVRSPQAGFVMEPPTPSKEEFDRWKEKPFHIFETHKFGEK